MLAMSPGILSARVSMGAIDAPIDGGGSTLTRAVTTLTRAPSSWMQTRYAPPPSPTVPAPVVSEPVRQPSPLPPPVSQPVSQPAPSAPAAPVGLKPAPAGSIITKRAERYIRPTSPNAGTGAPTAGGTAPSGGVVPTSAAPSEETTAPMVGGSIGTKSGSSTPAASTTGTQVPGRTLAPSEEAGQLSPLVLVAAAVAAWFLFGG